MATRSEPGETESWLEKHRYWIVALALLILITAYTLVRSSTPQILGPHTTEQLGQFGDALGPLASLFSLFALLAALEAVALQRREFSKMVEEAKQSSRAQEASALASRAQVAQEEHREIKAFLEAASKDGDGLAFQALRIKGDLLGSFNIEHLPSIPMFCGDGQLLGLMVRINHDLVSMQTALTEYEQKRDIDDHSDGLDSVRVHCADMNATVRAGYDSLHDHLEDCREAARKYFQDLLRNQGLDEIVALKKSGKTS